MKQLVELITLIKELRDKDQGDPWILEQDFQSLSTQTIEEAYEFAASIQQKDTHEICDELGDLLFHILLYAQIAEENNWFLLSNMIHQALDKQRRRRLRFNDPAAVNAKQALDQWERNKAKEKKAMAKANHSYLDGVLPSLPATHRAYKLQMQAAGMGFDWPSVEPIFAKIAEETEEIKQELAKPKGETLCKEALTQEIGDLLFSCINLARHFDIHPETALRASNDKFTVRFKAMEKAMADKGMDISEASLEQLDECWETVKAQLNAGEYNQ